MSFEPRQDIHPYDNGRYRYPLPSAFEKTAMSGLIPYFNCSTEFNRNLRISSTIKTAFNSSAEPELHQKIHDRVHHPNRSITTAAIHFIFPKISLIPRYIITKRNAVPVRPLGTPRDPSRQQVLPRAFSVPRFAESTSHATHISTKGALSRGMCACDPYRHRHRLSAERAKRTLSAMDKSHT
jgi:hypothetical protein